MNSLERERNEEKARLIAEIRGKEEMIGHVMREKEQIFNEVHKNYIFNRLKVSFSGAKTKRDAGKTKLG